MRRRGGGGGDGQQAFRGWRRWRLANVNEGKTNMDLESFDLPASRMFSVVGLERARVWSLVYICRYSFHQVALANSRCLGVTTH